MKNTITKIIATAAFGLIISSTAMASEEDYGNDVFVANTTHIHKISTDAKMQDYGDRMFTVENHRGHSMPTNTNSFLDLSFSTNK
ncbi:MAG: hypothetical protein DSZ29_03490 [Aquificaceae bacterium]|nr:MAG: hypothetical protein DSZ29_03490 [Aquificaceae bacterium]